jgi:glycosyltransferase involved in cell wall biosynthesis
MDKISIIVPIYNVEKYLRECIESIISQTYKNLEIILIDDGSPDNCGKICDEYARKDDRIKVIHKENGGVSDARNCGLDNATGKYLAFVDPDDYVDNTYIEKLYNAIKENNVQMSQCSLLKVNDNKENLGMFGYPSKEIKAGKDVLYDYYYAKQRFFFSALVSKMYDINLFKDIRFSKGRIYEDDFVSYKIYYNIDKIAIFNEALYFYRIREGSIMHTKFSIKNYDDLINREEQLKFFKDNNEDELYDCAMYDYINMLSILYVQTKKYMPNSKDKQKELRSKYKSNYKYVLKSKYIPFKRKLKAIILLISPTCFFKVRLLDSEKEKRLLK